MLDRGGVERAERVESGDGKAPICCSSEVHRGGCGCEERVCLKGCGGGGC